MITRVAVLITCHNRRETTLRCLNSATVDDLEVRTKFFVVDDGSTDGTSEAIRVRYPDVEVLEGNGDLYWCRGTEMAWKTALRSGFDGYLWLNDDVALHEGALRHFFDVVAEVKANGPWPSIVVGSTIDPTSGTTTYGGHRRVSSWHPARLEAVEPDVAKVLPIDTFNGNLVYVPDEVVSKMGIIDGSFSHAIGDTDYGLRARKAGISVLLAPGHFGVCARNPVVEHTLSTVFGRKGLPWRDWIRFTRRHGKFGTRSIVVSTPYLRAFALSIENLLMKSRR